MYPGSLSETFSSVFAAVAFALLGFCTSGAFGFDICSVFYIFTLFC